MLSRYLKQEELEKFIETIRSIYAFIPYTLEIKRDEAYFHTPFYLMVSASGVITRSEVLTCDGRIDLVMEFNDKVFIIEFKCNQSAEVALKHIVDKKYHLPYMQGKKKIFIVGINFNSNTGNIDDWQHEALLNDT
ncbi:hypothetical protein MTBBW1_1770025 [Desulfamplus magnetovallimortis]|uniref:AAA-ATPase-like domain-containing protein n=1 Tax=Desulfamplus magnetovallimortis TaxID=1246637 RepID=A0A1W1HA64_9BACT|nr:PD-(D/E)XK nuclease domain-containing protein [Desulfamplus magnetovallimortis]SLM29367.1 hypothetical protein MTBBW1_1770025 [Desulfamplus magnetovallimortis]